MFFLIEINVSLSEFFLFEKGFFLFEKGFFLFEKNFLFLFNFDINLIF